jgi:hypothetical protein
VGHRSGVILVREAKVIVVDAHRDHHTLQSASTVAASMELLGNLIDIISSRA